jgi:hypothetical protein
MKPFQKSIYKKLPTANLGFSVASSLFDLKEGDRRVTLRISFNQNSTQKLKKLSKEDIGNNIKVFCSGEKEWLSGIVLECTDNLQDEFFLLLYRKIFLPLSHTIRTFLRNIPDKPSCGKIDDRRRKVL